MVGVFMVYQLEANIAGDWVPIDSMVYGCAEHKFRELLQHLQLTPGQRLRKVNKKVGTLWYNSLTKELLPWQ